MDSIVGGATPLAGLGVAVAPPIPGAAVAVVVRVLPPDDRSRPASGPDVAVADPQQAKLVAVGETSQSPAALMGSFQEAIAARGWQSTIASQTRTNDRLSGFVVHYDGGGVSGSVTTLDCPAHPRRFVVEQVVDGGGPP